MDTTRTMEQPRQIDSIVRVGSLARIACGILAIALITASMGFPLWHARLKAPQYPKGLGIDAYGSRVAGDLDEINGLNHYIGMAPFDLEDFPELELWPFVLGAAIAAVFISTLFGRKLSGKLARFTLWSIPIGVLTDIQFRLFQYGHNLDPDAALRVPPFTPWVVGPTKTFNFVTWSYPGLGLAAFGLAAAVLTFGPRLCVGRNSKTRS